MIPSSQPSELNLQIMLDRVRKSSEDYALRSVMQEN